MVRLDALSATIFIMVKLATFFTMSIMSAALIAPSAIQNTLNYESCNTPIMETQIYTNRDHLEYV